MKIKILPAANDDLLNGYDFYEQQGAALLSTYNKYAE